MIRIAGGAAVAGLLAVAGVVIYTVVFAIASGDFPTSSVFWTSVGVLILIAWIAAWLATRIH